MLLIALLLSACSSGPKIAFDANSVTPYQNNILKVPVRLHLFRLKHEPNLNANMTNQQLEKLFAEVNLIWRSAGIEFYVESAYEKPLRYEQDYLDAIHNQDDYSDRELFEEIRRACDIPRQNNKVLNLCIPKRMTINIGGLFLPGNNPKVVWPIAMHKGKKPFNPATLAHEIGHFLGLTHSREEEIFLMRGRGNNIKRHGKYDQIKLLDSEILIARNQARQFTTLKK